MKRFRDESLSGEPPGKPPICPRSILPLLAGCALAWLLAGCDKSPFDNRTERSLDQAERKQATQDFRGAVDSYEAALDGTAKSADVHFRLGLIYSDKLNEPVSAVHHFRRYLEILPSGPHAHEARTNLDRLELTLATTLAGGTLISHTEATKLKAENKDLKAQLASARNPPPGGGAATGLPGASADRKPAPGSKTYQVQPGDTLASISRKFYKTKARAKDIQDANHNSVPDMTKLKPGQTLIIP